MLECKETFGFDADPSLPLWENAESVLSEMSPLDYFNRPHQMAYHNLCVHKQPPPGIGTTLGLGLKFCIQTDRPPSTLHRSFSRLENDVRKKYVFAGSQMKDIPQKIYVKSDWIPPVQPIMSKIG